MTALIGPSGSGKSTLLRILNRLHQLIPGAEPAGEVLLDSEDIHARGRRLTDARRRIGMAFPKPKPKPNPFPATSVYGNATAGLKPTGTRASGPRRTTWRRNA
ncbi:ATP-binding cassette domain-containing protein [Streptomyces vinaceus]|uniref:ATP-binding cassette domain-containing protein n=1 Tax=Streptomyces vinaceus TaxID=1960 RepID=UPI00382BE083